MSEDMKGRGVAEEVSDMQDLECEWYRDLVILDIRVKNTPAIHSSDRKYDCKSRYIIRAFSRQHRKSNW